MLWLGLLLGLSMCQLLCCRYHHLSGPDVGFLQEQMVMVKETQLRVKMLTFSPKATDWTIVLENNHRATPQLSASALEEHLILQHTVCGRLILFPSGPWCEVWEHFLEGPAECDMAWCGCPSRERNCFHDWTNELFCWFLSLLRLKRSKCSYIKQSFFLPTNALVPFDASERQQQAYE